MLTFLRKIRKSSIGTRSSGNYFLYAIGEIALVVIGILIALQINNWNELKKEANFERKVLNELEVSIHREAELLEWGIERNKEAISSCNIILRHFEEEIPYHDSLDHHFSSALQWFYPSIDNNAYEGLKSYGLHLIKNDSIRDRLGYTYEWGYVERLSLRQEEYFFNTISPLLTDLFYSNEFRGEMKPIDYDQLKKSVKYSHILRTLISNRKWQTMIFRGALGRRHNLSALIKRELDDRESFVNHLP